MTATTILAVVLGGMLGGFVSGLSGFAFGMVALSLWAWALEPRFLGPMVAFGSLAAQLVSLGAVRRGLYMHRLGPFVLGGVLGVPIGVALLTVIAIGPFRTAVGLLLVAYSTGMLLAGELPPLRFGGRVADGLIGFVGGVMGGLAGLSGAVPTLWCQLRGWDKDEARAVIQSFNLAMHAAAIAGYTVSGTLTAPVLEVLAILVPVVILPALAGARLYARISQAQFRRLILFLLLLSGLTLLAASLG